MLLVGILHLADGALWWRSVMWALVVWSVVLAGVATVVGLPNVYLVMALAGGGGMLVGVLLTQIIRRNSRSRGR